MDVQVEKERGNEENEGGQRTSIFSPQLKAMMRIKKKYLKRSNSVKLAVGSVASDPKSPQTRKSKRRKSRVLFPNDTLIKPKKDERSRAKPFLVLFSVIVFVQVMLLVLFLGCHFFCARIEKVMNVLKQVLNIPSVYHCLPLSHPKLSVIVCHRLF